MNSPIIWLSKKHNTVESSTFGSELVIMRIVRDLTVRINYKLRIFGVTLDGTSDLMWDNHRVVNNTSVHLCNLGQKQNAVNYHVVCEAAAAGIFRLGKEYMEANLADLLTNILGWKLCHKLIPFLNILANLGKCVDTP